MATLATTSDAAAGAYFQSAVQPFVDVHALGTIAQLQLAVAQLYTDEPPGLIAAADVAAGTFAAGDFVFQGAVNFGTALVGVTALATPSALAATGFNAFASTVSGAVLMGFGTTHDVAFKNRAGTTVIGITSNTTGVTMAGALAITGALSGVTTLAASGAVTLSSTLRVNGAASLGTAAGTDITVIDGTAFGAGVASLRLNGLTTAAVNNQTGTLLNAPSTGNPVFWIPISIAGSIRYIPAWA